jgi:hypothetical protein
MQTTYHRAFGIAIAITSFTKGEAVTMDPVINNIFTVGSDFGYVWYNIVGDDLLVNTNTSEQLPRPAGGCTLTTPIPLGTWRMEVPEDMQVLCINPFVNANKLPLSEHVAVFKLLSGEQTTVPHNSKLFLGHGTCKIDNKTIEGPQQVLFKSGDKTIVAQSNCYGFYVL